MDAMTPKKNHTVAQSSVQMSSAVKPRRKRRAIPSRRQHGGTLNNCCAIAFRSSHGRRLSAIPASSHGYCSNLQMCRLYTQQLATRHARRVKRTWLGCSTNHCCKLSQPGKGKHRRMLSQHHRPNPRPAHPPTNTAHHTTYSADSNPKIISANIKPCSSYLNTHPKA